MWKVRPENKKLQIGKTIIIRVRHTHATTLPLICIENIIEINPKIKPITNNDKTKGELNKEKLLFKKKKKKKNYNNNKLEQSHL